MDEVVNTVMGLRDSRLVRLDAEPDPGQPFEMVIEVRGELRTLDLEVSDIRGANYRLYHSGPNGVLTEMEPGAAKTYRGVVREDPTTRVRVSFVGEDLYGMMRHEDGSRTWFEPVAPHIEGLVNEDLSDLYVVYENEDVLPVDGLCGMDSALARESDAMPAPGGGGVGDPADGGNPWRCEIACDADRRYLDRWGNSTEDRIHAVLNTMDEQYTEDVNIRHFIATIIIRQTTVYTTNDPGDLLNQLRLRWIADHQNISRDIVHLFTGRNLSGSVIGIAWLSQICASVSSGLGYGLVQSDFSGNFNCVTDLSAHELGHNWAADHCGCSAWTMNASITCANRFSPTFTIPDIIAFRDSRNCLDQNADPPPNDDCADSLSVNEGSYDYTTEGATTDGPTSGGCGNSRFAKDIWYDYVPTCTGTATASLCGADYDTYIGAYADECPSAGALIGCDNNGCDNDTSILSFPVVAGEHYIIRVGGDTARGSGTLELTCVEGGACPEDLDDSGAVDFGDILQVLSAWGNAGGPEDLDGSGTVDFGDILVILGLWGPCP